MNEEFTIREKKARLGSNTAKNGFKNEKDIVKKFNNWKTDEDAQEWLDIMGYPFKEIEKVVAVKVHGHKTDVQVQITIYTKKAIGIENLSIKLASNHTGFNQIDKRWIDTYAEMWNIPKDIVTALKLFTGETKPSVGQLKDKRRMLLSEMNQSMQEKIVCFFTKNKFLIVADILKGRDAYAASWMLVALKLQGQVEWVLKSINHAMNVFGQGEVRITSQGSLKIGRIGMQRKGGDAGRPTANMLQFKINPVELFDN